MMRRFMKKLGYALTGLQLVWREESSFKIQIVCAAGAIALGGFLHLSAARFAILVLTISGVLTAEAFNTALEELCDKFQPTHDPHIAKIKDLAAAAVLLASAGAFVVGLFLFIPYL